MRYRERKRVFEEFKNLNSTGEISFQVILKQLKRKLKYKIEIHEMSNIAFTIVVYKMFVQ